MKQFLLIPIILSTFILGFLVNSAFSYSNSIKELPFNSLFSKNYEKESPSDFIKEEDIQVFPDKIIILVNNAKISSFEDTNSMDPLLDINHNGIEVNADCNKLEKGDIIAYKANWIDAIVIHRIIEINKDNEGIYFTTKGDNSNINDPQKIRCSNIKSKLVGVIY
ncbi:signal peptidase I [Candidatus Woesearchaeota archaeon]|nr:signal peptidase I [Candidatus Woesearchaeota archaeon]